MRGTITFLASPDRSLEVAERSIWELDVGPRDYLGEFGVPDCYRLRDADEDFLQRGGRISSDDMPLNHVYRPFQWLGKEKYTNGPW